MSINSAVCLGVIFFIVYSRDGGYCHYAPLYKQGLFCETKQMMHLFLHTVILMLRPIDRKG